jgi:electron transport complex protein RnfA
LSPVSIYSIIGGFFCFQVELMADYLLLFIGTVLVNNFVLVKFLGLCPFMGVSKNWKPQWGWGWPPRL